MTNWHVVQGATRVEVRLPAGPRGQSAVRTPGRLVPAKILGSDQETDLALLKVEARELPFLTLGDSDTVRKGQLVFALGSPRGLEDSMSMGLISATARQLRPDDRVVYFQTDAAINPGNSGGPLLDLVPRLGVLALPLEEPLLAQLPPLRRSYGILVARISVAANGSPGRLLPGDIIVAVNNQPVSTLRELRAQDPARRQRRSAIAAGRQTALSRTGAGLNRSRAIAKAAGDSIP